jgi:type IV pilus assembly protein PilB
VLADAGLPEGTELYRAVGCNECSGTGYRGRIALVELMEVTEEIERLAVDRSSSEVIRKVALEQGMRSLRDDGLEKALNGVTSLEEVLRIVEGRGDVSTTLEAPAEEVVPMRRRETGTGG